MAFHLSNRFPPSPKCINLLDPGTYELQDTRKIHVNKYPFLSNTPRKTHTSNKIWTHSLYYANQPPKMSNCTALQSKCPRFLYKSFSKDDLGKILCMCGIKDPCQCPTEGDEKQDEPICQANIPKCLYKGRPTRSIFGDNKLIKRTIEHHPSSPFYDLSVKESTAFYHGCKWSKRTSKLSAKSLEINPGPADYTIEKKGPTYEELCAERVRHYKRKTSKQLRFIEIIQERNIAENKPGPATYNPELPKYVNTQYYGPKGERFSTSQYDERPGPADYVLKRDFDLLELPKQLCHAVLPEKSCFGVKAPRFKYCKEENLSPASYDIAYKTCNFMHCQTAPFGSTAIRFKENIVLDIEEPEKVEGKEIMKPCLSPTWPFKSRTVRMKPLIKTPNEASPADLPQLQIKFKRLPLFQYIAPFLASEGRFQPWYDWMPVFGRVRTPGPAYYCPDSKRFLCVVNRGPLFRTARFRSYVSHTPAPNKYNIGGGVETVLTTYNQRLKCNVENQHKFIWKPPVQPRKLSPQEKEMLLLAESIRLLDTDVFDKCDLKSLSNKSRPRRRRVEGNKSKLLRSFLYGQQTPHYM